MDKSLLISQAAAIAHGSIRDFRRLQGDFSLKGWQHCDWRLKKRVVDAVRFQLKTIGAPDRPPIELSRPEARLFRSTINALRPYIIPEC